MQRPPKGCVCFAGACMAGGMGPHSCVSSGVCVEYLSPSMVSTIRISKLSGWPARLKWVSCFAGAVGFDDVNCMLYAIRGQVFARVLAYMR